MTDLQIDHHELNINDARALTDQIKTNVEETWHLVKEAYERRAWTALGYTSWDAYCDQEFGTTRLRLPRKERAEVLASLREAGLSIRAIASVTGFGKGTVGRDLATVPNGTPQPADDDSSAEELIAAEPTPVPLVNGLDGKTYRNPPQPPKEKTPIERRKAFRDRFGNAVVRIDEAVTRLELLEIGEDFAATASQLAKKNRPHLLGLRNRLDDLLAKLPEDHENKVES